VSFYEILYIIKILRDKNLPKNKAVILDVDGVVSSTTEIHFLAWKKLFEEYITDEFSWDDYKRYLDGVPREEGLKNFAEACGRVLTKEEIETYSNLKNKYYLQYVEEFSVDIFKDTLEFINLLKQEGVKVAAVSSSKNAPFILEELKIKELFDIIISPQDYEGKTGKPNPDVFLLAAENLDVNPKNAIVVGADIPSIEAAKSAGMGCIYVNRKYEKELLKLKPDVVVRELNEFDRFKKIFKQRLSITSASSKNWADLLEKIEKDKIEALFRFYGVKVEFVELPFWKFAETNIDTKEVKIAPWLVTESKFILVNFLRKILLPIVIARESLFLERGDRFISYLLIPIYLLTRQHTIASLKAEIYRLKEEKKRT